MSTFSDSTSTNNQTLAPVGVTFARTDEGLLVAKVGDSAFAMLPGQEGRFFLASAWRLHRPMDEWKRSDFYSHGGDLEDELLSARVLRKTPSTSASAPPWRDAKSPCARRLHGALPSMPPSMPTVSSVIRRQAMAASISMPVITRRSISAFARAAAGTRKIAPGRLWRRPFRSYSRTMSGAARIGPSAIGTRTLGRGFTGVPFSPVNLTRRIVAPLNVITHPTGS
jgi:hypothetical protein